MRGKIGHAVGSILMNEKHGRWPNNPVWSQTDLNFWWTESITDGQKKTIVPRNHQQFNWQFRLGLWGGEIAKQEIPCLGQPIIEGENSQKQVECPDFNRVTLWHFTIWSAWTLRSNLCHIKNKLPRPWSLKMATRWVKYKSVETGEHQKSILGKTGKSGSTNVWSRPGGGGRWFDSRQLAHAFGFDKYLRPEVSDREGVSTEGSEHYRKPPVRFSLRGGGNPRLENPNNPTLLQL